MLRMANEEHVAILKNGVVAWNAWRRENPNIQPDLDGADLRGAKLGRADSGETNTRAKLWGPLETESGRGQVILHAVSVTDLSWANLSGANLKGADLSGTILYEANLSDTILNGAILSEADLTRANLSGADLNGTTLRGTTLYLANLAGAHAHLRANFHRADLTGADLSRTNLSGAILSGANLREANLREANLYGADLRLSILIDTDLTGADLTGCRVYGVSAWGLKLNEATKQQDLIISKTELEITVDNIEVAQFIYLMLDNQKIRHVIDTITSKAVLILGRFTADRKVVLDALREELRKRDYVPILFDFVVPAERSITETVSLLARMARFVVADITDAKSIPQELAVIVPDLPSVPVQPLLLEGSDEYSMFEHFKRYPWVLETYKYPSSERLIADLGERVIDPAEKWRRGAQ
jgi:uncharacterized protein YjbI with pentapeptide repeats